MIIRPEYERPFHWWGPGPAPTASPALADLVASEVVSLDMAAVLCAALAQRRSLTVIGGPSGLGKSTLLHALLPWLPEGTRRVYLRGCYETFAFSQDHRFPPVSSVMLANEISPHLPVYLWGPAVRRVLALRVAGYPLLATAHALTVVEFVASLTGSPLRIPAHLVAQIDLVALMEPGPDGDGRRVSGIWRLAPGSREGVTLDQVGPGHLPSGLPPALVAECRGVLARQVAGTEPRAAKS